MTLQIREQQMRGYTNRIYINNGNTTPSPIPKTACWYPIVSGIDGTGPKVYGVNSEDFQYIPGQICPITSVADNGSGDARFYFAGGHPFVTGDVACIASSVNFYNGNLTVTKIDDTHFDISPAFAGSATGNVYMGDSLHCLLAANYYPFNYSYTAYFKAGSASTVYTAFATKTSVPSAANISTVCADSVTYHRVCSGLVNSNLSGIDLQFAYACNVTSAPTFASIILNIESDLETVAP